MPALAGPRAGGAERPPPRARPTATTITAGVVVVVLLATVGAYHYTLTTLLRGLTLDTPLAYLGLVPLISAALAWVVLRRPARDHDIHDRQVDLLLGLPLVAGALVVAVVLPHRMGSQFWVLRLDILSLPLFLAGLVTLLLGVRQAWRLRVPLAFLLVAWPVPWTMLLERVEVPLQSTTSGAVRSATGLVPLAEVYGDAADSMFEVSAQGGSFVVTVASACAGANSTLGFLLLGSAAMLVARGRRSRKLLWLATGVLVVWGGNVLRILVLLAAGRWKGESLAIDVLHPVLGTVVFAVASVVMLLVLPRFGVTLHGPQAGLRAPGVRAGLLASGTWGRTGLGLSLAAATLLAGVANGGLARNDEIVGPYGDARIGAFADSPVKLAGWHVGDAGNHHQAARYFGEGATWRRLLYHSSQTADGSGLSGLPVSIDAINTSNRGALKAFSVQACYAFHRFDVSSQSKVELAAGVRGDLFTYYNRRDKRSWNTLAWEWPVKDGATTRYERVVLIVVDVPGMPLPSPSGRPVPGSETASKAERLSAQRDFLRGFARDLVERLISGSPERGRST